jgi:hypothetical protein
MKQISRWLWVVFFLGIGTTFLSIEILQKSIVIICGKNKVISNISADVIKP